MKEEDIGVSMKASVIVPVYNSYNYLTECIDSIINQTEQDFELIIVNDCSPDNSQEIIDEYVRRFPKKIKSIYNEKNIGQGRSRMKGIDASKGEYIFFIDSDDYVKNDYLEAFLSQVKNVKYDIVVSGFTKVIGDKLVRTDIVKNAWTLVCYPLACCKMYRKDFILKNDIDFSQVRIGEDIHFSLSYFVSQPKYKFISYFGYMYRYNPTSTTNSMDFSTKHEEAVSSMYEVLLNKYDMSALNIVQKYMVEYSYVANMINALIVYGHGCGAKSMRSKYVFFVKDLNKKFPDWRSNPYYHIFGFEGPNRRIKIGCAVSIYAIKMHVGWPLYWLISHI